MSDAAPSSPASPAGPPTHRYNAALAAEIERRWQDRWDAEGTFYTPNPTGPLSEGFEAVAGLPKMFVMDMFPYPSGSGLHVGHPLGYIATDVFARFKRMTGHNVLHTMGYDAYGLPAEQHAMATGQHPRINTEANVATMRRQLRRLGLGHDPRRSVSTTDREFLEFTQRIFLKIFNAWFDPQASNRLGGLGAARPIGELIAQYQNGSRVPTVGLHTDGSRVPDDGRAWSSLTKPEQRSLIDSHRLVYVDEVAVNWCPGLGTIVANEEVTADGRSDRGNFPVFKRSMRQWLMRITAYSERLVDDLDLVDWPEPVRLMQQNWIGRSFGARVRFQTEGGQGDIEVFTTRPDTLFGATFMVLSPEHPMVSALTTPDRADAVSEYQTAAAAKSQIDRQAETKEKTGVFVGSHAMNPVNNARIPVFIADYVLMGYGTGAIMAVPSGDQRDFEFARAYDLPIVATIEPPKTWFAEHDIEPTLDCAKWPEAYAGDGPAIDSKNDSLNINGMGKADAIASMNAWLEANGHGHGTINTKLRDWLFSRQRYWGEPFPIVYDELGPVAVPDAMLPVDLPDTDQFTPRTFDADDESSEPERPLDRLTEWKNVSLDLGNGEGTRTYVRETNVMPQWAGSCSYYLRYIDPTFVEGITTENSRYWMGERGVDLYVGGVEHAVLHLLYSRFWHKVLFDLGEVHTPEPFARLFNQGYIQAHSYKDERGVYVEASEVVETNGTYTYQGKPVNREFGKIGKSLKNMVTPDDMYSAYGADTLRVYEMSMGPLEQSKPWDTRSVPGAMRLLQRIWRVVVNEDGGEIRVTLDEPTRADLSVLHHTIDAVRGSMDDLRVNTPIARLTELTNHLTSTYPNGAPRSLAEPLVLMLAPFAPHLAEELWSLLGHPGSLIRAPFPVADPQHLMSDTVEVPVQVNGKVRAVITVANGLTKDDLETAGRADEKIAALLVGKEIKKVIAVPGKLVNFVVAG